MLLDLSAAFDTVDHEILITRLKHRFGITGKALVWIHSYLSGRTHFVKIGTEHSSSKHISFRHCETSIYAFVTSKMDHYNILLSDLKQDQVRKLQYVQNSAARLLTGTRKHEHITPVLRDLHWLPVHKRICFKILLMTFKCLNQLAPSHPSDLLIHCRPSRTLLSSDKELLVQPRCYLKTYGERAFSFNTPKLWNTPH